MLVLQHQGAQGVSPGSPWDLPASITGKLCSKDVNNRVVNVVISLYTSDQKKFSKTKFVFVLTSSPV